MTRAVDALSPLNRYTHASEMSAGRIIAAYSTSFGTATRLLGTRHRTHVRNIYALVRVADELVDGATAEAEIPPDQQHLALDRLEQEVEFATDSGYSSNPIVHAFAHTARASGIGPDLTRPFFASMRTDLTFAALVDAEGAPGIAPARFGDEEHAEYVYGSAEVIGLMCLRVFARNETYTSAQSLLLERGARCLGAAFQNVNFLRDLADDTERLGRSYLSEGGRIDTAMRDRWLSTIGAQLSDASSALPLLPKDSRVAVGCALRLFQRLAARIAETPVDELYRRRVRVSTAEKAVLIAQSLLSARKERAA